MPSGKWDYIFGRAQGAKNAAHNAPRTAQNVAQMNRVGVWDTPSGRSLLQSHFDEVVRDPTNTIRSWSNRYGSFETRESLLIAPGGFLRLHTTWQVLEGGARRMTTVIPMGG